MRLKHLLKKFEHAFDVLYGGIKATTKAAVARLNETVVAAPGTFESATAAQINRDLKNAERHRGKRNTRGLPKGYSVHEHNRAKLLQRSKKHRAAAGETSLQAAQTYLDDEKACRAIRARRVRVTEIGAGLLKGRVSQSFASVATPRWRQPNLREFVALIRAKIKSARQTGRVPYVSPENRPAPAVMRAAEVKRNRRTGSVVVTPTPATA